MKKIVHIAQSAGGVAEYLYMFLKNFNTKEYENILIVSEDYKEQIDRFKNISSKVYFVPMIREIKLKEDLRAVKEVKKIIKKEKPDIVYLHSSKAGAIGRLALFFNLKTTILYNAHGWYFNAKMSKKKKLLIVMIERILALRTDKIINISQSEYDSAIKYKIAGNKKMCVIENGIDFNKFKDSNKYREETRKKYNIKKNEKVIGVVGRLTEQKDPMTSIKAFELIYKNNKNVKLMFVGDGELKEEVIDYANRHKLEKNVIVTEWVNEVEKYIPAFDVAILPSKWEGFGLVLIEYMACDKPIVATNVGGIADIIKDKENGILVEVENYEQLADEVEKLIKDNDLSKNIIENNKTHRTRYEIKNLVKEHIKYLEELV